MDRWVLVCSKCWAVDCIYGDLGGSFLIASCSIFHLYMHHEVNMHVCRNLPACEQLLGLWPEAENCRHGQAGDTPLPPGADA